MDSAKYVIIGAGLAGMSTAFHLAASGETGVLVLEQEEVPGLHSSGRNAAMVRQVVPERKILSLAREGADFIRGKAARWPDPAPFAPNGSLLVASGERWKSLQAEGGWTAASGAETEVWTRERICGRVPCAEGGDFEAGVWCPSDGVTDAGQLLGGFSRQARERGVRLLTACPVLGIETREGKVTGVRTNRGTIEAGTVVNAGGPWAGVVGRMAGALAVEFKPMRRHLYYTGNLDWADPRWPYVWDVAREVYFRPESAGLLLCPCDETPAEPGLPNTDPAAQDLLAEKLTRSFPRLLEVPLARAWAGLRTFTPDRLFMIGWDPRIEGFYWVAGLGGHGVTTSPAVGRLAAEELLDPARRSRSPFAPSRFA
jgi:D-arginine dehydrogenase